MPSHPHAQAYAELKGLLAQQGLFDRQPRYYTWKILQTLSGLGVALGLLLTTPLFWLQLLNAAFLACVFTQMAFLGHDAAHRQVFQSAWKPQVFCLLCPLLTAISYSWWTEKHNRHHRHPNHLARDPDVQLRFLTLAKEPRPTAPNVRRVIVKHQAWWFVPMLLLQGFAIRIHSIAFLRSKRVRVPVVEPLCMAVHVGLYLGACAPSSGCGRGWPSCSCIRCCSDCIWARSLRPTIRRCSCNKATARSIDSDSRSSRRAMSERTGDRLLVWRTQLSA